MFKTKFISAKRFFLFSVFSLTLASCGSDLTDDEKMITTELTSKEVNIERFATLLSKVTHERRDVRAFLKEEALKQFDKNYDVLYIAVKDKKIGEKSFRDVLISYSSLETIEEIEKNVPLLNILIPEIAVFDINPQDLDIEDTEIPVALSKQTETDIYINGKKEVSLKKGEIPDFHVFVVNENERVIPVQNPINTSNKQEFPFVFKSPYYDGTNTNNDIKNKVMYGYPGVKAVQAFQHFYKDDGSINQKSFQRDYIYYGITPQNQQGGLNRSVSEYIGFMEVNPNTYFKISDQDEKLPNDDPRIKSPVVTQKKRTLTQEELLDRMWTKGAYEFVFELITSNSSTPIIKRIPLKPNEIWNFNIKHERKHGTAIRSSKNTYTIDPNKFTSKLIYLDPYNISFGKWNIAEESLYRYVKIYEEDESIEITTTETYEHIHVNENKFNGDVKLKIGIADVGLSGEATNSNTTKTSKTVTMVRKQKSDDLGASVMYFYEPIIEGVIRPPHLYKRHYYNTGSVIFGISVK